MNLRAIAPKTVLLAMFAMVFGSDAFAGKNAIEGQVFDRNGEPVVRAVVTLTPGNVQLVTDVQGKFLIDYARDEAGERVRMPTKVDVELEVFKPGFHTHDVHFFYKRGAVQVEQITLSEDTIEVEDDAQNLDPGLFSDRSQSSGATYEGQ